MAFIILLILSATSIAGAAAFFSVYGLASTFSGTFWSVVAMGASLEAGKLIAASYLYRYWNTTNLWLKGYLMAGVAALMLLTSTGIFGYLSSGYQTDVLPLKQAEQQVKMYEDEKQRLLTRKTQIDNQIASLPTNSVRGRTTLMRGFKSEQTSITARIGELDKTILDNKTKLIQTQAHIGPITYIASAFGLDTDNATKYLIYLIIFAFDPMAVALTLAVNIALKQRKLDNEEVQQESPPVELQHRAEPVENGGDAPKLPPDVSEELPDKSVDESTVIEQPASSHPEDHQLALVEEDKDIVKEPTLPASQEQAESVQSQSDHVERPSRRVRPYASLQDPNLTNSKLAELMQYYNWLKQKDALSQDEQWELDSIRNILKQQGLGLYIE